MGRVPWVVCLVSCVIRCCFVVCGHVGLRGHHYKTCHACYVASWSLGLVGRLRDSSLVRPCAGATGCHGQCLCSSNPSVRVDMLCRGGRMLAGFASLVFNVPWANIRCAVLRRLVGSRGRQYSASQDCYGACGVHGAVGVRLGVRSHCWLKFWPTLAPSRTGCATWDRWWHGW